MSLVRGDGNEILVQPQSYFDQFHVRYTDARTYNEFVEVHRVITSCVVAIWRVPFYYDI
jgi:hypothetical protein